MHISAMKHAKLFLQTYAIKSNLNIIEVGSQDVQGSIRNLKPSDATYTGYDFVAGLGVDVVVEHPYKLPIADNSIDIVISSSCYEHASLFWMNFVEAIRVLKPNGIFYMQAPSNGEYHRWPVDCWRFYPDSGLALAQWARLYGFEHCHLLESFVGNKDNDIWKDFVGIWIKNINHIDQYPNRILNEYKDYSNGITFENSTISKLNYWKE